jgi:hypothetical protein
MRRLGWVVMVVIGTACSDRAPTATVSDEVHSQLNEVATAATGLVRYDLILTGGEEAPPANSQGYGAMRIAITPGNVLEAGLRVFNPGCETIVAGHIHRAPAGEPGPVVVALFGGSITPKQETLRARVALEADLAQELRDTPEAFYVNYHSTAFPGGFIRAQLGTDYPDPSPPTTSPGPC